MDSTRDETRSPSPDTVDDIDRHYAAGVGKTRHNGKHSRCRKRTGRWMEHPNLFPSDQKFCWEHATTSIFDHPTTLICTTNGNSDSRRRKNNSCHRRPPESAPSCPKSSQGPLALFFSLFFFSFLSFLPPPLLAHVHAEIPKQF